jgi:hypothetical protein
MRTEAYSQAHVKPQIHGYFRAALFLVAALAFLLACDLEESSTTDTGDIAGSYDLKQVNNTDLTKLPAGVAGRLIISGGCDLAADGTWSIGISSRGDLGFSHVSGDHGTYSIQGNRLTFHGENTGATFTGQINGGQLTVDWELFEDNGKPQRYIFTK